MLSVNSIESFSTIDGPGIRTVIFLNKCLLRCIYCHNPEMWNMQPVNYSEEEIVEKVLKNKNYFGNNGGVTFSGGEPLLQAKELIKVCKLLKKENINIAIDTAGYSNEEYEELLKLVDLVIFDIKDITNNSYRNITNGNIEKIKEFINSLNRLNKKIIIRQVIVPTYHNNIEYITKLAKYIKNNFKEKNIIKIEFLPYHKYGEEKYKILNIEYPCKKIKEMDINECLELYNEFINIYNKL